MPVLFSRVNEEVEAMAKHMADVDQRSVSSEIAWLIRQEWGRRYSQAQPLVTLGEAVAALGKGEEQGSDTQ